MAFRNPFKRRNKHGRGQSQEQSPHYDASATNEQVVTQDAQKRAPSSTTTDVKEPQSSSQDQTPPDEQALLSAYFTSAQAQPPRYRSLKPDPFDPTGPPYGYQYEENAQNFPHPSSVSKDIGKEMKYNDPKAADLAHRASQSGREDLKEMMNYFLRQQELGKKSFDPYNLAWNGV